MIVALAQLNPIVGDLAGNAKRILDAYRRGVAAGAQLVVCPELCLTGYPPRDLLLRRGLVAQNLEHLQHLAGETGPAGLVVGFVNQASTRAGRPIANAAAVLQNGRILEIRSKTLLPTYDVFDEDRYFEPAKENAPVAFDGLQLGVTICEDIWNDDDFWPVRRYESNPPVDLAEAGAEVLLNISASPWHLGKNATRHAMLRSLAVKTGRPVVFCNQVGGNDELIFDGESLVFGADGALLAQGKRFEEDLIVVDLGRASAAVVPAEAPDEAWVYGALVLGLRDYLHKCGFRSAVLGLSGGIDSAVTACLAVAALGPENVSGVSLPSEFSSQHSLDDARALAERLGIAYDVLPIQSSFKAVKASLEPMFQGRAEDTTEENLQARLRGVMLMALSNKFGSLLLTTGNKSEVAVGYCTLYGDMCGGLSVISDVPKVMVYRLARWINREREIIPLSSITKPPSAELRPNQTDQDSLPPYEVLDAVLDLYVVEGRSPEEIIAAGYDAAAVRRVVRLIDGAEYKRRQAAPGLKVTTKAFGVGRRIPIAHRYREG
jgi:NAD+ synthetase